MTRTRHLSLLVTAPRAAGILIQAGFEHPSLDQAPQATRKGVATRCPGTGGNPRTAQADRRGVTVLPDVLVNSGTNAWWWTLFGGIGAHAGGVFAKVRALIRQLTGEVPAQSAGRRLTPRAAAHRIAAERLPGITERFGACR